MTFREKLADWISGGALTRARDEWLSAMVSQCSAKNIAARDHASYREHRYHKALDMIARNTCCDKCQEAANVAREALK